MSTPPRRPTCDAARARREIVEPGVGRLASKGEQGVGRLAEPARLLERLRGGAREPAGWRAGPRRAQLYGARAASRGLRVLVTAGGTREPIDSVRFIGNSSSGRMGFALAQAARERGAEVTLLAANVALPPPPGVRRREVVTAAELKQACEQEFPACDVLLMAAAVADFRPAAPADGKIKKAGPRAPGARARADRPTCSPALAAQRREGQTLIGFAAEHGEQAIECARGKLTAKGSTRSSSTTSRARTSASTWTPTR
jgi:phosphopantothenoylcysteine decarboxylase/phosphopantothenate--cysteine ligase